MAEQFTVWDVLPATPREVYDSWLSSDAHAAMTGGEARIDPRPGGAFEAWDGYITGTTLELEPGRRIVQAWRTSEFSPEDADSRLEVTLEAAPEGTRITLHHSGIPDGQTQYEQGWRDSYFEPMREYFARR